MLLKMLLAFACLLYKAQMSFAGEEDKQKVIAECMQKHPGMKEEDLGNFKTKGEIQDESNADGKCWFLCVTTKFGMGDETGKIDVEKMKPMYAKKYSSKMTADAVNALIEKCAAERSETNPCDKVYQFHRCHMKAFVAA